MFTVLVVCTGNVNRSALGAVLLERWAEWYLPEPLAENVRVTSAGLGAPVGARMGRRARVIADALGAESSLHRAAQISEDAIRRADLVLVASAQQREDVLGQVPAALHSTFTIREAGRIVAAMPESVAPESVETLRARVEAMAQGRGSGERGEDDIVDPQGKDDEAYRLMVRQEVPALARLANMLFGMPPAEVRAYDAAAEAGEFSFAKGAASGEVDAAYPPGDRVGTGTPGSSADVPTRRRGRREA